MVAFFWIGDILKYVIYIQNIARKIAASCFSKDIFSQYICFRKCFKLSTNSVLTGKEMGRNQAMNNQRYQRFKKVSKR